MSSVAPIDAVVWPAGAALMLVVGAFAAPLVQPCWPYGTRCYVRVRNPKMVIKAVELALVAYQTDNTDSCPRQLDDLYTQKYLTKEPRDPWGEPLVFTCPGKHNKDGADLVSKGKDKTLGTVDDIRSWEL